MGHAWVRFRDVKEAVSMEMALAIYGIRLRRVHSNYLRGRCPLPSHDSRKSAQSFSVNTDKNAWACHSESCVLGRQGRVGGNVLDFVAAMENCSIREAALRLQGQFSLITSSSSPVAITRTKLCRGRTNSANGGNHLPDVEPNRPLPFTLKGIERSHPYLAERGISEDTATYFGIGFFPGKGTMSGRIAVPIHNETGELIAYAGRALAREEPKY